MTDQNISEKLDNLESKIDQLYQENIQIMNLEETAKYLDLSKSYLYKLTMTHQIPHYKPKGKRIYFNKSEIDQWVMKTPIKTAQKLEDEANDYVTLGKGGDK